MVGITPAQAANENSACHVFSNQLRADLREVIPRQEWGAFNRKREKGRPALHSSFH